MESKLDYIKNRIKNYHFDHDTLDKESIEIIYDLYKNDLFVENKSTPIKSYDYIGLYFMYRNEELMLKYLTLSVEQHSIPAMRLLALYYISPSKYDENKVISYYQMAVDRGDHESMCLLGFFYQNQKKYDKMVEYYLMAYQHGNPHAINYLTYFCETTHNLDILHLVDTFMIENKDVKLMKKMAFNMPRPSKKKMTKKYLKMAISYGDVESIYLLGCYYGEWKNIKKMLHYYLQSIDNGYCETTIKELLCYKYHFDSALVDYLIETHCQQQELLSENNQLKQQILELTFQPGGPGYLQAREDFYLHQKN